MDENETREPEPPVVFSALFVVQSTTPFQTNDEPPLPGGGVINMRLGSSIDEIDDGTQVLIVPLQGLFEELQPGTHVEVTYRIRQADQLPAEPEQDDVAVVANVA